MHWHFLLGHSTPLKSLRRSLSPALASPGSPQFLPSGSHLPLGCKEGYICSLNQSLCTQPHRGPEMPLSHLV